MNTAVIIPAFEPDTRLLTLLQSLVTRGFSTVFIIDDGSSPDKAALFAQAAAIPGCSVLRHRVNRGKGAAIKTGIRAVMGINPPADACVTVDADGQHLLEDVLRVTQVAAGHPGDLVLGIRCFSQHSVPVRSRMGNLLTRYIFRFMTKTKVTDTQTGLRVIPAAYFAELLALSGDRYEYEMNMLIWAAQTQIGIREVPVQTVYVENNKASHFNPVTDSLRIYREIAKYAVSSLVSSGIDYGLFALSLGWLERRDIGYSAALAFAFARIISSCVNFILNRHMVFRHRNNRHSASKQAVRYAMICGAQMLVGMNAVELLEGRFPDHTLILKIIVDITLFAVNYLLQRRYIFNKDHRKQSQSG